MNFVIERMKPEDWPKVRQVYEEGINTGHATFEAEVPDWPDWDSHHLREPRLVAKINYELAGWAALSPVSRRKVYAGVAEVSIYIAKEYRGQGIGSALLAALIRSSETHGIWTLQAGIFPENQASINLHLQHGFQILGRRRKIGQMTFGEFAGVWRDVILMERRSKLVGID